MINSLPNGVRPYKKTAVFTETSIPAGLLNDHQTKESTWALIHVLEGQLRYIVTDPRKPPSALTLTTETPPGIVEPTILHRVQPLGEVRFYVEFLRTEP